MPSRLELDMTEVVSALGAGAAPHVYGVAELAKRASPPRVVWERGRMSFEAPAFRSNHNPQAIHTILQTVQIHIWARSDEELEQLAANEIVGLSKIANASYRVESFEPGGVNEEWIRLGHCGVLIATVKHSLDNTIAPVAQIVRIEQDPNVVHGDYWLEVGDFIVAPFVTFDSATSTITRSTGDWSLGGTELTITGSVSNDGTLTILSEVGGTLTVAEPLTDEIIRLSQINVTSA
jgi:hypothetical protein